MSCLALSLQPTNGSDILLQTREWFPPALALVALSAFRQTRLAFATGKNQNAEDGDTSLGDDPLAASSGQVIVGVESRYRVVYRLVNSIYVLGITTVDDDCVNNVFECISIVNQTVKFVTSVDCKIRCFSLGGICVMDSRFDHSGSTPSKESALEREQKVTWVFGQQERELVLK